MASVSVLALTWLHACPSVSWSKLLAACLSHSSPAVMRHQKKATYTMKHRTGGLLSFSEPESMSITGGWGRALQQTGRHGARAEAEGLHPNLQAEREGV